MAKIKIPRKPQPQFRENTALQMPRVFQKASDHVESQAPFSPAIILLRTKRENCPLKNNLPLSLNIKTVDVFEKFSPPFAGVKELSGVRS